MKKVRQLYTAFEYWLDYGSDVVPQYLSGLSRKVIIAEIAAAKLRS